MRDTEQTVNRSIGRLRAQWPASGWTDLMVQEYRRALRSLEEPEVIDAVVTRVIDEHDGRYVPQVATILAIGKAQRPRRRSAQAQLSVDEEALVDAINALDGELFKDAEGQAMVRSQIEAIRRRLPDRGARVEGQMAEQIRFVQAKPDHRDDWYPWQPVVRYFVAHPGGQRNPQWARAAGE